MRTINLCLTAVLFHVAVAVSLCPILFAAGGTLTLSIHEESTEQPTISRIEIFRADAAKKKIPIRLTVPAGIGVVLDRKLELTLPDSTYRFRLVRGPEYRVIRGKFTLERTSLDSRTVRLPRMADMLTAGWTSGDCCVSASQYSLPLRMAAEDLHVAGVLGHIDAKPVPRRDSGDPIENDPSWIREDVVHHKGIVAFGVSQPANKSQLPVHWIADLQDNHDVKIAVENPFAWPLPVWLASEQIDGFFLLGDWLRLDRSLSKVKNGRPPTGPSIGGGVETGRWAMRIYQNMLESGLRISPLAGSGTESGNTPVGYNRLYVADASGERTGDAIAVTDREQWWRAAWDGKSVATNGPMLRPTLEGKIPGHVFRATSGDVLELYPELSLSVRDPVDYLDVVHNGQVHYSARLDEFAKAGGAIPPLHVKESGWVMIRVVTLHEDHFRAALSAPWYIDFDDKRRVTPAGVKFFQDWLADYEERLTRLPKAELKRHAPYIRRARAFWKEKSRQLAPSS